MLPLLWIVFFCVSCVALFVFVGLHKIKSLWPIGLITLVLVYIIDNTFISFGAFSYSYPNPLLDNLPLFYWLSGFCGGIILANYYPNDRKKQFPYILLSSACFLAMEVLMSYLGYFHYHNWHPIKSYILDIFGFTLSVSLAVWFRILR